MSVIQELRETKLFKEIRENEELMVSIQEAVQVLQEEGFDPNKSSMMIFVTNARVREKMTRVMAAVQAAGVDPATAKVTFWSRRVPPFLSIFHLLTSNMQNAEAGPSNSSQEDVSQSSPSEPTAPLRPLPSSHYYSVEYPGYIQPGSLPLAIERLGGQAKVDAAFKRTAGKTSSLLELRLRPTDPFAHPIAGEVITTNNILLKVVKRKRKQSRDQDGTMGEYIVEAMGVVPKTARFRSMADYQYRFSREDSISKLRYAMQTMDVEGILNYNISEEQEDYTVAVPSNEMDVDIDPALVEAKERAPQTIRSNLRLPPPPLFSRQTIPQIYNYKANPASVPTTYIDEETGEEKKRLINRMRWKGFGPIAINFSDKGVPDKPSQIIEDQRSQADQNLLKRLEQLFQERPVWTRTAIFNQFSSAEVREIVNSKFLLPLVSYVFQDGPWRDTQVRIGYDPREDPEARFYQRVYFRNLNHPISRPSVLNRRQEARMDFANARTEPSNEDKRSHIFDGLTVTKETAAFQLCDLHDPMLKEMVEEEEDLRETCNERDGWFSTHAFERIKLVLRHKFFSLLSGHIASREECEALLVPQEGTEKLPTRSTHRIRPSKHNMAKGALRPEDAAAQRLVAVLEKKAKDLASQRQT
ncbi:hypothetical protein NM688_g793 [Phlebia brevispora]|uniref:Uncharacterized protein n=1 Tax=Phlebia brevispora TaxID=194682 RepID=A0ACC1TCZ4_9APHY|nr:hypothetical protein NM688_g793 [Phlebia brevispora]